MQSKENMNPYSRYIGDIGHKPSRVSVLTSLLETSMMEAGELLLWEGKVRIMYDIDKKGYQSESRVLRKFAWTNIIILIRLPITDEDWYDG